MNYAVVLSQMGTPPPEMFKKLQTLGPEALAIWRQARGKT